MTEREQQQKTIAALAPIVDAAAFHVRYHHLWPHADHQLFGKWPVHSPAVRAEFSAPGRIDYRLEGGAEVQIHAITVVDVDPDDIDIGPIVPTGEQRVVRSLIGKTRNETLNVSERELTYRDLDAEGAVDRAAKEVSAAIEAGLRQQIGYGGEVYGISGETEFSLKIQAGFKAAWDREMTSRHEAEATSVRKVVDRAMHETTLERVETVGPARQTTKMRGRLSFGIRLHSPGKFLVSWDSIDDFIAEIQGIEAESGPKEWRSFYRAHPAPLEHVEPLRKPIYAEVSNTREFQDAVTVDVAIRERALTDKAKLTDALTIIAASAQGTQLRGLAAAELKRLAAVA